MAICMEVNKMTTYIILGSIVWIVVVIVICIIDNHKTKKAVEFNKKLLETCFPKMKNGRIIDANKPGRRIED